ncbi:MAG: DUF4912 domain-containing protein [Bryobacteraceae bacterium]|jgi:hypothetical protein
MTDGDAGAAEPLAFETGDLPDLGEDSRLVLMPVDPYLMYAYWNVTSTRIEAAKALFEEGEIEAHVLRFHDTTGIDFDGVNCGSSFDVKIHLDARKWYVRLWSPERKYCADIGLRGKDGRLVALVRSNLVETPAAWPHVKVDEAAALVDQGAPEGETAREAEPLFSAQEPEPLAATPEAQLAVAAPEAVAADSRHVLERRLAEVAALREEPLAPTSEGGPGPSGDGHADLTEISEKNFSPGISSAILGARRPGQ